MEARFDHGGTAQARVPKRRADRNPERSPPPRGGAWAAPWPKGTTRHSVANEINVTLDEVETVILDLAGKLPQRLDTAGLALMKRPS